MNHTFFKHFESNSLAGFMTRYPDVEIFDLENANQKDRHGYYLYKIANNHSEFIPVLSDYYYNNGYPGDGFRWLINGSKIGVSSCYGKIMDVLKKRGNHERSLEYAFNVYLSICTEDSWLYCDCRMIDQLATAYDKGTGVVMNKDEAQRWFFRGAQREEKHCLAKTGQIFISNGKKYKEEGFVEEGNSLINQGIQYYYHTFEMYPDYTWAKVRLFDMYIHGDGVEQNYLIAKQILEESIANDKKPRIAHFHMGLLLSGEYHCDVENYPNFPRDQIPIDRHRAFKNFVLAANFGEHRACAYVGKIYEHFPRPENHPGYDDIVPKNLFEAFRFYEKGYRAGNDESCLKAGMFYENFGEYAGVIQQDNQRAKERYLRGSKKNNHECIQRLAFLQQIGIIH